jgi:micrococcal nuclease
MAPVSSRCAKAMLGLASTAFLACRPDVPACPSPSPTTSAPTTESEVKATVDSCNDGDTCRIRLGDQLRLKVRLAGIDAPESGRRGGQPLGLEAKQRLNSLVKGREVVLKTYDLDAYNRPIVEMSVDGLVVI